MKTYKVILLGISILLMSVSIHAQKGKKVSDFKSQKKLSRAIIHELKMNYGDDEVDNFKKIETKQDFVVYLKNKSKKCEKCTLTTEFSLKLDVEDSDFPMKGKLTYGSYVLQNSGFSTYDDEDGTDPEPDQDPDEDPDKDEDGEGEAETSDGGGGGGGCGPYHCLSLWGEHFPCQGVPGH